MISAEISLTPQFTAWLVAGCWRSLFWIITIIQAMGSVTINRNPKNQRLRKNVEGNAIYPRKYNLYTI